MIKNINGKATIVGVFSWTVPKSKCAVKYPGVFTNVAKYLQWIKDTMTTIKNATPPPPTTPTPPPGNIFKKK